MDLFHLLEPIGESLPCGDDLRLVSRDLTLEKIRDLRKEVTPEEDLATGRGRDPDWRAVMATCERALGERTKDLEIANSLCEAWMHTQGMAGLARGLALIAALLERYWDTLHPGAGDEVASPALRSRHLAWIGGSETFLRSLRHAPLVWSADGHPVTFAEHAEARRIEDLRLTSPAAWQESIAEGAPALEQVEAKLRAVPPEGWGACVRELEAAQSARSAIVAQCELHLAEAEVPSSIRLRDQLDEMAEFARLRAPEASTLGASQAGALQSLPSDSEGAGAERAAPLDAAPPLRTRDDALRRLEEIATFLRTTEPHSPVSYLVARAVRWGDMPLDRVLRDVVKDPGVLHHIWDTLGIAPAED